MSPFQWGHFLFNPHVFKSGLNNFVKKLSLRFCLSKLFDNNRRHFKIVINRSRLIYNPQYFSIWKIDEMIYKT